MQILYVILWWLLLQVLGFISFPLVSRVCGGLRDRGYSISKLVGLLLFTYFTWMLSSLHIISFGYPSILLSFFIFAAFALYLGRKNLKVSGWPGKQIIISDSVFTGFFIVFVLMMMGSPDIFYSGANDAYFNSAFINSILRGGSFPPPDPLFAGESISYYYGGHVTVAMLSKATSVPASISFNIAGAMFYALAVCAAYGLGYNITGKKLYGGLTVLLVCVAGYLAGAFQLAAWGLDRSVLGYTPVGAKDFIDWLLWFDFWTAPWIIDGALVHYPYFSFIMGDLHSYFMSIPFQLMFITLIFALYQKGRAGDQVAVTDRAAIASDGLVSQGGENTTAASWHPPWWQRSGPVSVDILIMALCLGFFFILNSWEYPTYIIFTGLAFILLGIRRGIRGNIIMPVAIIILSFVLYLPHYLAGSISSFSGLGLVTTKTSLAQFLEFSGMLMVPIFSLGILLFKRESFMPIAISAAIAIFVAVIIVAVIIDFPLLIIVIPLILFSFYYLVGSRSRSGREFVVFIILIGALLALFCDLFYIDDLLDGDWARFNTVMKLYQQLWVFLSVAAAIGVFYVLKHMGKLTKYFWLGGLSILIIASLIHPVASTTSMLSGRHSNYGLNRGTLDGMEYIKELNKGDYDAIKWLNEEIKGSPVIVEAPGNPGLYSSRISVFTGLPAVIGWGSWELMWRRDWLGVEDRNRDVEMIYNTVDNQQAIDLLRKYNVQYIYIGTVEREEYAAEGLQKFARMSDDYQPVYEKGGVTIYKVGPE